MRRRQLGFDQPAPTEFADNLEVSEGGADHESGSSRVNLVKKVASFYRSWSIPDPLKRGTKGNPIGSLLAAANCCHL
jgi:hypothetical protein